MRLIVINRLTALK